MKVKAIQTEIQVLDQKKQSALSNIDQEIKYHKRQLNGFLNDKNENILVEEKQQKLRDALKLL